MPNDKPAASETADALAVYKELCQNIRATDDISFSILRAVPATAGVGSTVLTGIGAKEWLATYPTAAVIAFSLLGAVITFGLFRWELRNIQKCTWLITRAARLEDKLALQGLTHVQFSGMESNDAPAATKMGEIKLGSALTWPGCWGKTQAAKLVYTTAVVAWLIPAGVGIYALCA